MKKIKLEYNFCVFLLAYLNQADLSLHRAGWTSLMELKRFYSSQVNPREVIKLLVSNANIDADKLKHVYRINQYRVKKRQILSLFHFSFRLSNIFLEDEIYYICQQLIYFAEMLEKDVEVHPSELEELRLGISKFTFGILKYKISYKDYNKALRVEHYMQHEILKDIKIKEVIKKIPGNPFEMGSHEISLHKDNNA